MPRSAVPRRRAPDDASRDQGAACSARAAPRRLSAAAGGDGRVRATPSEGSLAHGSRSLGSVRGRGSRCLRRHVRVLGAEAPMTTRLFYHPGNASLIVHVLLEEIGAPFELEYVDRKVGAHKSE